MTTPDRIPAPDADKVRRILRRVTSASVPQSSRFSRFRESYGATRLRQNAAFTEASEEMWNEFRRIERRATVACAEIAAKYSPEAAAEILSRPDLEPWSG